MSKIIYVGPTIVGVATKNTVYSKIPDALQTESETAPFLTGLCIPVPRLAEAMDQIRSKNGAIYTLYKMALQYNAKMKGEI